MFNITLNSNILFGLIMTLSGVVLLYNFLKGRNGDRFKGKIPLIILSTLLIIGGLVLFVLGWIYLLKTQ